MISDAGSQLSIVRKDAYDCFSMRGAEMFAFNLILC